MMRALGKKYVIVFSLILFSISASSELFATTDGEAPRELEVVFLDVGQGDAILIFTPRGRHILIDGGTGEGAFGLEDQGKKIILPYLRRRGIKRLDTVIATHPDFDHIGGLVSVVSERNLEIGELLDPGVCHPSEGYLELLQAVQSRPEVNYRQSRAGEVLDWGEEVKAEVVSPPYLMKDNNDSSIVVKLTYDDISFLFTGDAAGSAEKIMIGKYGLRLRCTVLKTGHHGSKHSTTEGLLQRVRPEVAILSCGADNSYGHPNEETIQRLRQVRTGIYRTDEQGTITVITDGKVYRLITERQ